MMASTGSPAAGPRVFPAILSGGAGTRLWPMSRESQPKQLLPLLSACTMVQETALRFPANDIFAPPLVVCSNEHRFLIAEQLRRIGIDPTAIVLEPAGRNTAAASAVAALQVRDIDPAALMLLVPADHAIPDLPPFLAAIRDGLPAAADGALVGFGVTPRSPETGYGYIRRGAVRDPARNLYDVAEFVQKPSLPIAESYLAAGDYYWNSGIFLFRTDSFLEELGRWQPQVLAAAEQAIKAGYRDLDFVRLHKESFAAAPVISVDAGVMVRTDRAVLVPIDVGWSDVGSWSALWELAPHDAAGNAAVGDVLLEDVHNAYVRSDSVFTAVVGLDNVVVAVTDDAVLVAAMDRVQDIKAVVRRLKDDRRREALTHRRVYRPWGCAAPGDPAGHGAEDQAAVAASLNENRTPAGEE
ncbi:MAG: mannose-1-phosphate guanylyltransferase/mannose-6-phosphate isomerase [Alphaproteobacteria bacterium]|jgi:mannose-1-phosphate guanylyltransferase/mannose-6-phosphate isomerase|nr:mannose-1-phosphate guanylyltransferase/mannose-6-phosphate isomerase [Alphaproteobacteria bacterium]